MRTPGLPPPAAVLLTMLQIRPRDWSELDAMGFQLATLHEALADLHWAGWNVLQGQEGVRLADLEERQAA